MYHNFLIHSSVDGHLGCFRVLAIVNSAGMNTVVHVSRKHSLNHWTALEVPPLLSKYIFKNAATQSYYKRLFSHHITF